MYDAVALNCSVSERNQQQLLQRGGVKLLIELLTQEQVSLINKKSIVGQTKSIIVFSDSAI